VTVLIALQLAGKDVNALAHEDIAIFDEFYIRGRAATIAVGELANIQPGSELLDLGCGIQSASEYLTLDWTVA